MAEGSWQGSSHCLIFPRGTGNSVLPSLLGTLRRPSPVQPGLAGDPRHSSAPLCTFVLAQMTTGTGGWKSFFFF